MTPEVALLSGRRQRPLMSAVLVSVVVPMYNAEGVVEEQLGALEQQTYKGDFEVVLVDNRSTDGTPERLKEWAQRFPGLDLRLVSASAAQGVSHARNVGVACARGSLIAICDADDRVVTGWLQNLVDAAASADMVGGGLLDHEATPPAARRWRSRTAWAGTPRHMGFLPYAHGCNVAVWRDAALAVRGWDETYRSGGDDIDFAWRVQLAGGSLIAAPQAAVHYRQRSDLKGLMQQTRAYAIQDVRLYRQYRSVGARRRSLRDIVAGLIWLATRWPLALTSPARAGWWLRKATAQVGRLEGSMRFRVFYP